jgi:hypothetical protein
MNRGFVSIPSAKAASVSIVGRSARGLGSHQTHGRWFLSVDSQADDRECCRLHGGLDHSEAVWHHLKGHRAGFVLGFDFDGQFAFPTSCTAAISGSPLSVIWGPPGMPLILVTGVSISALWGLMRLVIVSGLELEPVAAPSSGLRVHSLRRGEGEAAASSLRIVSSASKARWSRDAFPMKA